MPKAALLVDITGRALLPVFNRLTQAGAAAAPWFACSLQCRRGTPRPPSCSVACDKRAALALSLLLVQRRQLQRLW